MTDLETCLPHRPPMLLVDRLVAWTGQTAETELTLRADNLFLLPDGTLEHVACLEIMAQCFAAGSGAARADGLPGFGYLAAVRALDLLDDAHLGDTLHARVRIEAALGSITLVEGEVRHEDRLLARGTFSIYVPPVSANNAGGLG